MAIAHAEKGLKVTTSKHEEKMAQSILQKAQEKGLFIDVHTESMEPMEEQPNTFNEIVSFGNTLPHLSHLQAVENFLEHVIANYPITSEQLIDNLKKQGFN